MVGPLDSQIVINQSVATEKVQEVQQRHPDLQQRQFALQLQEEEEKRRRDIRDTEKTDQALIRSRERKEKQPRDRRRTRSDRRQKGERSVSEDIEGEETGSRVDVYA